MRAVIFQQLHVGFLREMALVSLHDDPGDGQSPFLVDRTDHQSQTLPPRFTAIYGQEQRAVVSQTFQQCVSIGQEVDLAIYPLIIYPAGELLDSTLLL